MAAIRVVAAWPGACPGCGMEGSVMLVGADGSILARCFGSLGPNYIYHEDDPSCHGSFQVNDEINHWAVSDEGPLPDGDR